MHTISLKSCKKDGSVQVLRNRGLRFDSVQRFAVIYTINGSQLAKMEKYIPVMS